MSHAKLYYGGEEYRFDPEYCEDVKNAIRDSLTSSTQGAWIQIPLEGSKSVTVLVTPGTPIAVEESPYMAHVRVHRLPL